MTRLTVRNELPPPPTNFDPELHTAFAELCERLQAGGAEILPVDAVVIARTVQAEAALQRAREAAAKAPLCVDSPANGKSLHPLHRYVAQCESSLRAWLRLLPRGSGGRIPSPHVPTPAGDAGAAEPPGEPSARLQRLRAILAQFQADQASAGAAGDGAAAGVGGCVDAAAAGVAGAEV